MAGIFDILQMGKELAMLNRSKLQNSDYFENI